MESESGELIAYDFKGTYTYSGNTATIIATHLRITGNDWESWSGKWTTTLTEDGGLYWVYDGAISRMLLKQISGGYGNMK